MRTVDISCLCCVYLSNNKVSQGFLGVGSKRTVVKFAVRKMPKIRSKVRVDFVLENILRCLWILVFCCEDEFGKPVKSS